MKPTHTLLGLLCTSLDSIRGLLGFDPAKVKVKTLQGRLRAVNAGLKEALSVKSTIKEAIEAKSPSVEATEDLTTWAGAIESIQTGDAPTPPPEDVVFMDWDGTVVKSYSFTQAKSLSALPALPARDGMTNEGWNYTLAQIKSAANASIKTVAGCTYRTRDNITRIHVTIPADSLTFHLNFAQTVSRSNTLSWGDGSGDTPGSTTAMVREHTYAAPGDYIITFQPLQSTNTLKFSGPVCGDHYADCSKITAIDFGGVNTVSARFFTRCMNLKHISVPKGTSMGGRTMDSFSSLEAFVIPAGMTSLPTQFFQFAANLKRVSIPPSLIEVGERSFYDCPALTEVCLPTATTTIRNYAFYGCSGLCEIHGPSVSLVEWNVFGQCGMLSIVDIPCESYGSACFHLCKRLIELNPTGVLSSIGTNENFLQEAVSLQRVGELHVETIPDKAFYGCVSLKEVKVSGACATIGSASFRNVGCLLFDFTGCTRVPQIQSNTFAEIASDAVFLVPANLYSTWRAADVWSGLANQIKSA